MCLYYKKYFEIFKKVTFKSQTISLNLIDLVLKKDKSITNEGSIQSKCNKIMEPVTFSSPQSYIPIKSWFNYPKIYSFSIEFQTTENYGVLAYILGPERESNLSLHYNNKLKNQQPSPLGLFDRNFFSLEIHNRFLNAYFNFGSSYIRHEIVHEQVSGGKSHQLLVEINEQFVCFKTYKFSKLEKI